jgi:hypothetical protein
VVISLPSQAQRQARYNYRVRSLGLMRDYHPGFRTERVALTHNEYIYLMEQALEEDAPKLWTEVAQSYEEAGIERTTVQPRTRKVVR